MPLAGFETAIPVGDLPQTRALWCAVYSILFSGAGKILVLIIRKCFVLFGLDMYICYLSSALKHIIRTSPVNGVS
jgi:hypothetical protein